MEHGHFLQNKYTRWYSSIIEKRLVVPATKYVEKHHIIPRSMGGSNEPANIVKLSPREHFVCHHLLTKMTSDLNHRKMMHAFWMMANNRKETPNDRKLSSITYALLKQFKSDASRGNKWAAGKHSKERIETNRRAQLVAQNRPEVKEKVKRTKSTTEFRAEALIIAKRRMSNPLTREKIAVKHRKPVVQIDLVTGETVTVFGSALEAEQKTNTSRCHISSCISGKRKQAGGFKWMFEKSENNENSHS